MTDPASVYGVLERAAAAHGGVDLVVNAAPRTVARAPDCSAAPQLRRPSSTASIRGLAGRAHAAFSFLSASGRFAVAQARPATLVQVTGGSARRAMPGRGL